MMFDITGWEFTGLIFSLCFFWFIKLLIEVAKTRK